MAVLHDIDLQGQTSLYFFCNSLYRLLVIVLGPYHIPVISVKYVAFKATCTCIYMYRPLWQCVDFPKFCILSVESQKSPIIFKDVLLSSRRVLSLYKVYGDSALLALNWRFHLSCRSIKVICIGLHVHVFVPYLMCKAYTFRLLPVSPGSHP